MRLSVSKIKTFEQCPHKYKLQYIDEVQIKEKPEQLVKGVEIHEIFDKVFEKQIETLEQLKEEIYKQPNAEKYKEHIDNFIKFNERISTGGKVKFPLYREIKLFDNELNITGVLDRVDFNGKNLIILDYKTGKNKGIADHHFQLGIYKYLFEKLHNIKVTHWGIFYTEDDEPLIEPVNNDIVKQSVDRVIETRKKIKLEVEFPKRPSFLCNYCEFFKEGHCEGYRASVDLGEKFWEDAE